MRVALVTTPPSVRSGIGDYTRHLLPHLREHCEVVLFVRPDSDELQGRAGWIGEQPLSILDLDPNEFDQVLYQLGNEFNHAFMMRMIRLTGGTVMQHDWVLFDLALANYPALVRGGAKGHLMAAREGGAAQARLYMQNWIDRRRERNSRTSIPTCVDDVGQLLAGWHAQEGAGRWVADEALLRIPAEGVTRVEVELGSEPGRKLELSVQNGPRVSFICTKECAGAALVLESDSMDEPLVSISTDGITVSAEQRSHGDGRRLGSFVSSVKWTDADGEHHLDLSLPATHPLRPVDLSRDRFRLPLNRSVVDYADAFIVHSDYVGGQIKARRGAKLPMGKLPHGSSKHWQAEARKEDRRETRRRLGMDPDWCDGFLVVSFGGVQAHKRIDHVLAGLAEARKSRDDIFMVLAGGWHVDDLDPVGIARMLGVDHCVKFTGYVEEEEAWDLLHAGDVSINLRGPTSGGTSGGIYQALSLGRAVIATDAAEQSELPDDCIPKVPLGGDESEAIGQLFVELAGDPKRCKALEKAARRYVDEDCYWGVVGKQYADYLASFPKAKASPAAIAAMRKDLKAFCDG
ncbi:MAG: glycosyltransferase involved in cell wall biosynthesis [Planctomycetota bacterium]|jgi:glycosyltransferase involved in cell wall biosynthesis